MEKCYLLEYIKSSLKEKLKTGYSAMKLLTKNAAFFKYQHSNVSPKQVFLTQEIHYVIHIV